MSIAPTIPPRSERGSTLIEFGLVITVLLLFLFGIIDFGRALYAYHFVGNAARQATRFAIVRGTTWQNSCDDTTSLTGGCQASSENVQYYVQQLANGSGIYNSSGNTNPNNASLIATLQAQPSPDGGSLTCNTVPITPGCTAEVTVQYAFQFIFPFLPTNRCTLSNGVAASVCMTSTSEMVVSQ